MSEQIMHVRFNKETGEVLSVGGAKYDDDSSIPVALSEVQSVLDGTEQASNYHVLYNAKLKQMEFKSKHYTEIEASSINDFIYEVPEEIVEDPDFVIVQDIPNTCWKLLIGEALQQNLKSKSINLNHTMMISITAKGDPNILYKTLFAELSSIVADNYVILPFTMPFEHANEQISVYTSRRFDSYQFKRIFNE